MLIAHLTDLHLVPPGQLLGKVLDVNELARRAVETVNSQPTKPAWAVVTGDLTHNGSPEEMALVRETLDELDMPYFAMPGGHDDPEAFSSIFASRGWRDAANGDVRYVVDQGAVRLVVVDTTNGKGRPPSFDEERCAWLDAMLAAAPDKPTLLAMHHPPFQCRIPVATYVDDYAVTWAAGLKGVVSRHRQVASVVCGHVHRATHVLWAGTLASIGPSSSVQSDPVFADFRDEAVAGRRVKLAAEPGGWQALWWDGDALVHFGLLTDRSYARY